MAELVRSLEEAVLDVVSSILLSKGAVFFTKTLDSMGFVRKDSMSINVQFVAM